MDRLGFCVSFLAGLALAASPSSGLAAATSAAVASTRTAAAVSMAGRQRMLSRRMAKFYFYRIWELV